MDQNYHLSRCTLIINDSQSENNNQIEHSIVGANETIIKNQETLKQKQTTIEPQDGDISFQRIGSNESSTQSQKSKAFSKLLIYFHSTRYANKLLSFIRPDQSFTKQHFSLINDQASSYNHLTRSTKITTNIVKQHLYLITCRIKLRMKFRALKNALRQQIFSCYYQIPLVEPQNYFKLAWDFTLSIMRIYLILWIPIILTFHEVSLEQEHSVTILITCFFLILDIMLRAFTVNYDKGLPITDRFDLLKRQFNIGTFIELFSIFIGIVITLQFSSETESPYLLEIDGLSRLILLLFYLQISNILSFIDTIQHQLKLGKISNSFIDLLKLVSLILIIQHFCCCMWVVIGEYKQRQNATNWLTRVEHEQWGVRYLESFYFMSVTMFTVGYGEIVPTNSIEKIFCICYMFLSTLQLSFSVNTIGTILTQIKENNEKIRQKMTCINEYMQDKQISNGLQYKVREYFNFYWEQEIVQKKNEQSDLIQLLPEELQNSLNMESAQILMNKCDFFVKNFSPKSIKQILKNVQFKTYQPGVVIENNDFSVYIIEQGLVEVTLQKRSISFLKENEYFGHVEMKLNQKSKLLYKTSSFCSILVISGESIREAMLQNEENQEKFNNKPLLYCYICKNKDHNTTDCTLVHFVPDFEKVIKKHNFKQHQDRKKMNRKQRRKNHFSAYCDQILIGNSAKVYQIENDQIIDQIAPTIQYEQPKPYISSFDDNVDQKQSKVIMTESKARANNFICKATSLQLQKQSTMELLYYDYGYKEMLEIVELKMANIQKYTLQQQQDLQFLNMSLKNRKEDKIENFDRMQNLKFNRKWNFEKVIKKVNKGHKNDKFSAIAKQFQKYLISPYLFIEQYKKKRQKDRSEEKKKKVSVIIEQYKSSMIYFIFHRSQKHEKKEWKNSTINDIKQYKLMSQKKYLDSPIFSIACLHDFVLVSCGGGGKRFGLVNSLFLYPKPIHGLFKNPLDTFELGEEIFEKLRLNKKTGLIVGNSEEKCVILKIIDNKITIVTKFESDRAQKDAYQNDGVFNYPGDTLATGGEDGTLRVWNQDYQLKYQVDMKSRIQSLDFNVNNGMLIVATDNEECKILKGAHVVHKLDISQSNVHKLKFHSAFFSLDGNTIFTFKNPMRGNSYMTSWRMEGDNIRPIKTIKIHGHPVVSSCQSNEGMFMGVGCSDGTVKIINTRYLDTETQGQAHEMPCKALCFTPDSRFLISGSADFTYNFLQNIRPSGWFSWLSKMWLLGMVIAYLCILIMDLFQ